MKKQFVSGLKDGAEVDSLFAVKFKKPVRGYKNGFWFEVRLSDKTDEITVKYWGGPDEEKVSSLYGSFDKADVLHITGIAKEYPPGSNMLEIGVNEGLGSIEKTKDFDIEDFVGVTERNVGEMYAEVVDAINSVTDENIKKLLRSIFVEDAELAAKIKSSVGSMSMHHNYIGGLLEHNLNVLRLCLKTKENYPELNRDLLIAGALLHDIGKLKEYSLSAVIDISEEGMLAGHIASGTVLVLEKIRKIHGFPENLALKIEHMILSHHGRLEYGSPKVPQFPEAIAVYQSDELDAKTALYLKLKREAKTEDKWFWSRKIGEKEGIGGHVYLE